MARNKNLSFMKITGGFLLLVLIFVGILYLLALADGVTLTAYIESLMNADTSQDLVSAILLPYSTWVNMLNSGNALLVIYAWTVGIGAIIFTIYIVYPSIDQYIGLDPGNKTRAVRAYRGNK